MRRLICRLRGHRFVRVITDIDIHPGFRLEIRASHRHCERCGIDTARTWH